MSSKVMAAPNSNGPRNWKNEIDSGRPDIMLGMRTWLLGLDAR